MDASRRNRLQLNLEVEWFERSVRLLFFRCAGPESSGGGFQGEHIRHRRGHLADHAAWAVGSVRDQCGVPYLDILLFADACEVAEFSQNPGNLFLRAYR